MDDQSKHNAEAVADLPEQLQTRLKRFLRTRSEADLTEVITAVLRDYSANPVPDNPSDDFNFVEDLGLDSLAVTEFVFFFEDIFGIRITNEELAGMLTMGELKKFLMGRLG